MAYGFPEKYLTLQKTAVPAITKYLPEVYGINCLPEDQRASAFMLLASDWRKRYYRTAKKIYFTYRIKY